MAVLKCKMCGGTMEITNESVAVCEYCDTKQTVPTVKDENLQGLFNRATALRLKCEFDKAEQLYEKIISADNTQAEAYWGLILCKYGIEYVEDPATFKRVPTCHRTSFDSIIADDDYAAALDFADAASQKVYEAEAKEIDRLQKEILALSQKEEPYDVFICYKETDDSGKRTQDSVIANDIYYQLSQEGFKVFYAAITLEDKLGSAYEPCIFAALNSSKVMLAIGTKPEYFGAVWVKNEWSRYLKLMKKDRSKLLIPCYRDMDAYELPDEFAHLQAQDMSKIGFINDVVRGIKKVIVKDEPQANASVQETIVTNVNVNIDSLMERAFMFLEDGDWQSANEYCEKVLDQDPKHAKAYLGKLMAEVKVKEQADLVNCANPFDNSNNYAKAVRFADDDLKQELQGYVECIKNRIAEEKLKAEEARKESVYQSAKAELEENTKESCDMASELFESISGYKDSDEMVAVAKKKADEAAKREVEEIEQRKKEKELKIIELAKVRKLVGNMSGMLSARYDHLVGLKADGTVVATGKNDYGQCDVGGWSDIIAVSAGSKHTVALKGDGTVVAVGLNDRGQCDVSSWSNIIAVSAGGNYTLGLKADGTVVAVGDNNQGQCEVKGWTNIVAVSAGFNHAVGLKSDGTCVATQFIPNEWFKEEGRCDVYCWSDIVAISAGDRHTVGLRADGTLVAAGDYYKSQLDKKQDIIAISAKARVIAGLKADGTVDVVGYSGKKWDDVVAVSAGDLWVIVGLKVDGTVKTEDGFKNANRWKLFDDISSLEKRHEEVEKKIEQIKIRGQRCSMGVCQHCGGQLKGLFTKKCANCGKQKDY